MEPIIAQVLQDFGFQPEGAEARPFGSGLIHHTWRLKAGGGDYILQEVNDKVFRNPPDIAHNIRIVGNFLTHRLPDAVFPLPILTAQKEEYSRAGGSWFRLVPFVAGTHTVDTCDAPAQAFEAARQFGQFTANLDGLRMDMLRHTIPGFHDLSFRFRQFQEALEQGDPERKAASADGIDFLLRHGHIAERYEQLRHDPAFVQRVTHHDTKISNVLLDEQEKGVCVIDLDTVMPGYFISDLGDMMRTYLSPASEEEKDFDRMSIRQDNYEAIVEGYALPLAGQLTQAEKKSLFYSGEFMIYMQALRFLTDHLNMDRYYGAAYPGHNFVRGMNQVVLLDKYLASKDALEKAAARITNSGF